MASSVRPIGVVALSVLVGVLAAGNADAATFSRLVNYGGDLTIGCVGFEYGVPPELTLSDKYIDGIPEMPPGALVTNITVRIHGFRAGTGVDVLVKAAGEMVATLSDPLPETLMCNCENTPVCQGTDFVSSFYPDGWPGWDYVIPRSNRIEIDVTATDGSGIAVDMITVIVTYQLATAAPSVGSGSLFALHQNQPNPFNPRTVIHYELSSDGLRTSLRIYDLRGSLVRTLVDEPQFAGSRSASWNGCDESGRPVASGVYFYRLTVGTESQTKRLMLLK